MTPPGNIQCRPSPALFEAARDTGAPDFLFEDGQTYQFEDGQTKEFEN